MADDTLPVVDKVYNYFSADGLRCTVCLPPDESGVFRAYSKQFSHRDRDKILSEEVATGNYLAWDFTDVTPPEPDSEPEPSQE